MRFLESLLYGLFSGLAEFLPVSAPAHQAFFMQVFGMTQREPLRDLLVHIALIFALKTSAQALFSRVRKEQNLSNRAGKSPLRRATAKSLFDLRLVRTASLPMLVLMLLYLATSKWELRPIILSIVLVANGVMLIIPEYMRHGNKDARSITSVEAILIGVFSGLSAFPGISRIGACLSVSAACGADRQNSINWALMLSRIALCMYTVFDLIHLIIFGLSGITFLVILGYLVSAIVAFASGYLGVLILRFITEHSGLSAFAFYSWGMALFVFILYLIT